MSAAWVYRCYDADGRLLYVGATRNLSMRLATHEIRTWWAPQVAKVRAVVMPSIHSARFEEKRAIRAERPRWNVLGRSMARIHWTRQDYADYVLARTMCSNWATAWTSSHLDRIRAEFTARFGDELQLEASA